MLMMSIFMAPERTPFGALDANAIMTTNLSPEAHEYGYARVAKQGQDQDQDLEGGEALMRSRTHEDCDAAKEEASQNQKVQRVQRVHEHVEEDRACPCARSVLRTDKELSKLGMRAFWGLVNGDGVGVGVLPRGDVEARGAGGGGGEFGRHGGGDGCGCGAAEDAFGRGVEGDLDVGCQWSDWSLSPELGLGSGSVSKMKMNKSWRLNPKTVSEERTKGNGKVKGKLVVSQPFDFRVVASGSGAMFGTRTHGESSVGHGGRDVEVPPMKTKEIRRDVSGERLSVDDGKDGPSTMGYLRFDDSSPDVRCTSDAGELEGPGEAPGYDGIPLLPVVSCHARVTVDKSPESLAPSISGSGQKPTPPMPSARLTRTTGAFAFLAPSAPRRLDLHTGARNASREGPRSVPTIEQLLLVASPTDSSGSGSSGLNSNRGESDMTLDSSSDLDLDNSMGVLQLPESPSPMPRGFGTRMRVGCKN